MEEHQVKLDFPRIIKAEFKDLKEFEEYMEDLWFQIHESEDLAHYNNRITQGENGLYHSFLDGLSLDKIITEVENYYRQEIEPEINGLEGLDYMLDQESFLFEMESGFKHFGYEAKKSYCEALLGRRLRIFNSEEDSYFKILKEKPVEFDGKNYNSSTFIQDEQGNNLEKDELIQRVKETAEVYKAV